MDPLSEAAEGTSQADTDFRLGRLISDFGPPDMLDDKFM